MKKSLHIAVLGAACVLVCSGAARAQSTPPRPPEVPGCTMAGAVIGAGTAALVTPEAGPLAGAAAGAVANGFAKDACNLMVAEAQKALR